MREHKISSVLDHNIYELLSQGSLLDDQGFDWRSGVCVTPYTNRGVLRTFEPFQLEIHPGWFTVSYKSTCSKLIRRKFHTIKNFFCTIFKDGFIGEAPPAYTYQCGLLTSKGAVFYYSPDRLDFTIKMSETFCCKYDVPTLLLNIKDLAKEGGLITRMDQTIDDFSKQLNIKYIHDSRFTGELCSRISTVGYGIKHRGTKLSYEETQLGCRESLLMSRIYDKAKESQGKIDSIRWEMEMKGNFAQNCFHFIFQQSFPLYESNNSDFTFSSEGYAGAVMGILSSKYDFKDPATSNQKWRATQSPWWTDFLGGFEKAVIPVPKVTHSIDKTITWVREQVGTSLTVLKEHFKEDFLDFLQGVIEYSQPRLRKRHLDLLRV